MCLKRVLPEAMNVANDLPEAMNVANDLPEAMNVAMLLPVLFASRVSPLTICVSNP